MLALAAIIALLVNHEKVDMAEQSSGAGGRLRCSDPNERVKPDESL